MKIVALFSIKGGVGKTAAAVNLAYLAARDLTRTLVWDLDPQAASTFYFRVKPKVKGGVVKLLQPKANQADKRIKGTDFELLDILPADDSYRNLDLILDDLKRPKRGLGRVLAPLQPDYDLIILDCPPTLSLLSENIIRAADALLVPVIPTPLSLRTLEQLEGFCEKERLATQLLPFLSMVDRRKKLHGRVADELLERRPDMLASDIPYSSVVEQMGVERAPVGRYASWTPAGKAYQQLYDELRQRLWGSSS